MDVPIEHGILFLIIAAVAAFFMAFNNGANDVANSFASAVGSKAITVKQALLMAAVLNVLGAVLLGRHVATKLVEGVIDPAMFPEPIEYIAAMFAVLLAAGTFVLVSTLTGLPVSSSHSIVGSLVGVGIVVGGWESVNWPFLGTVVASWAISPFLAGLMSLGLIAVINKLILKGSGPGVLVRVAKGVPILMSLATAFAIYAILEGTRFGDVIEAHPVETALLAVLITIPMYITSRAIVAQWVEGREDNEEGAEASFKHLQIGTSCYVAFAHGSNDVANSISPVIAISVVVHTGAMSAADDLTVPFWILAIGGVGIATGIGLLGHRVMKTVGEKITTLTNSRGFSVDFSVASTVVVASIFGLPVSSSHAATGAVVGVGLVKGPKNVNFRILGKIVVAWLITVPVSATLTTGIFMAIRPLF